MNGRAARRHQAPCRLTLAAIGAPLLAAACGAGHEESSVASVDALPQAKWVEVAPLPTPVTNNAVAGVAGADGEFVFSFLGLGSTRSYSGIHRRAFRYDVGLDTWSEIEGPPLARIAATAVNVRGTIYLFSGYTVAADGGERTLPDVDIYDPRNGTWRSGAPMPVPADDAVSAVWRDSLIYMISGWSDRDNVRDVQVYDPFTDSWTAATPIPGPPVFGHAGAIARNTILYVDGVRTAATGPRFRITNAAYRGEIDPEDPSHVVWQELPPHPGPPRYRMAAGALGSRIVFAGGTANPYNYSGIGYDGNPSEPVAAAFAFDVQTGRWESLPAEPVASMDHRGLAVVGKRLFVVGGMLADQHVTPRVQRLDFGRLGE